MLKKIPEMNTRDHGVSKITSVKKMFDIFEGSDIFPDEPFSPVNQTGETSNIVGNRHFEKKINQDLRS